MVLMGGILLWRVGFGYHRKCSPTDQEAIYLPRAAALLFGMGWRTGPLSLRGIVTQMLAYIMVPLMLLHLRGTISQQTLVAWCGASSGILLLFALGVTLIIRSRN